MVVSREINWQKILLAFLIACFLFSFGIFVGYLAKQIVIGTSLDIQENIRSEIASMETINLLEKDNICNNYSLDLISEKLDYLGQLITMLEVKKGKDNMEVLELKKLYTDLEVRHYLIMNEKEKQCGQNYTLFLFFYSNGKDCKENVEKQSFILSYLRKKYENVRVYSFDTKLNYDLIRVLDKKYDAGFECSDIIMDEKKLDFELTDSAQLEKFL